MSTPQTPTNTFLIPLTSDPQQFDITLGGVSYLLTVKWNALEFDGTGSWVIDIADSSGNPIICNIPMITGDDLLDGLEYLGIPGSLYVYNSSSPADVPTLDNLGVDANLIFVSAVSG